MSTVCAHCGTESITRREEKPWCGHCGIWLIYDEQTTEWISFAEYARREARYRQRQAVAQTGDVARATQPAVDALLPAGWRSSLGEPSHGGCYTLELHSPAGPVDVYAYLVPPIDGFNWRVRIHNRTTRVCRTLFAPGTATAAIFPDALTALTDAIAAVRAATTTGAVPVGATL